MPRLLKGANPPMDGFLIRCIRVRWCGIVAPAVGFIPDRNHSRAVFATAAGSRDVVPKGAAGAGDFFISRFLYFRSYIVRHFKVR